MKAFNTPETTFSFNNLNGTDITIRQTCSHIHYQLVVRLNLIAYGFSSLHKLGLMLDVIF